MFSGCQAVTKQYGGTTEIKIQDNYKLIEATWKDNQLWYLVEPMEDGYMPKTKYFIESSLFGVLEGKVVFIENKDTSLN